MLTIVGFVMAGQERFFQAYLVAYIFWIGIVLGSMALLMVQHLSGGAWGVVIRRPLEAAVRTMPIMAVLFMPIVARDARPLSLDARRRVASDPVHRGEGSRISTRRSSSSRQVFYFAIWIGDRPALLTSGRPSRIAPAIRRSSRSSRCCRAAAWSSTA